MDDIMDRHQAETEQQQQKEEEKGKALKVTPPNPETP
jgi:hypothetical protein